MCRCSSAAGRRPTSAGARGRWDPRSRSLAARSRCGSYTPIVADTPSSCVSLRSARRRPRCRESHDHRAQIVDTALRPEGDLDLAESSPHAGQDLRLRARSAGCASHRYRSRRPARALTLAQAAEGLAGRDPAAVQNLGGLYAPDLGEGQHDVKDLRGLQIRGAGSSVARRSAPGGP